MRSNFRGKIMAFKNKPWEIGKSRPWSLRAAEMHGKSPTLNCTGILGLKRLKAEGMRAFKAAASIQPTASAAPTPETLDFTGGN